MNETPEPNLDLGDATTRIRANSLTLVPERGASLSPVQTEFNKLMKKLETARSKMAAQRAKLDRQLAEINRDIMPLAERENRANLNILRATERAVDRMKLTPKRLGALTDLMSAKGQELLNDPVGLTADEIAELEKTVDDLGPSRSRQIEDNLASEEFDMMREVIESMARQAGVNIDLSGLDPTADPHEYERMLHERIEAAEREFEANPPPPPRARKPTKAQLEKERRRQEAEEAKKNDLKSLFKQLAKVLHPDLETDPEAKAHKESWMKRLTTAYAANDLRDMLQIEMEWLGEEAGNLASASDRKLKVYCAVLKEQIADIRDQTEAIFSEPQYGPIRRFIHPYMGTLPPVRMILASLHHVVEGLEKMLEILKTDTPERRKLIHKMADEHARALKRIW
ncbi:MAG: J domain-containing protein [Verrucomicrobia bacterium]|nr:J domain-containing protein [Verrucomicrobiota bacterium]